MNNEFLVIGDPHLRISIFDDVIKFIAWIEQLVETEKPKAVVYLGDTFHNHAVIRSEIMCVFYEHIKNLCSKVKVFYILGNHECYKPDSSKYHALVPFRDIENFILVDSAFEDEHASYIPYIHIHRDFPKQTKKLCFTHNTFVGADFNFKTAEFGVVADDISADLIISGHIHKRQVLGKVLYPGTPYAMSASDVDQQKGVMFLDVKTYDYRYVDSPFPLWRSLDVTLNDQSDVVKYIANNINSKDHWIINLTGYKKEVRAVIDDESFRSLKKKNSISVKTKFIDSVKETNKIIKASSLENMYIEYVDKIYAGNLDKDKLKVAALKILVDFNNK